MIQLQRSYWLTNKTKANLCFRKIPETYNRKLTSAKIHSPSPSSRSSSFMRRLFSLAVSRYLLRRSSPTRRLFSLAPSRSFSSCSSVKFCLLSLILSCFLSRCSSVKLRLLSLALCRSRSRWAWLACRLFSRFLCLSLYLYSKLEVIINKIIM